MTLDEAIKYFEEMIEIGETYEVSIGVEEHRQLAEWLKDYKRLKEEEPCVDKVSSVEDLLSTVRKLCEANGLEFFFAVPNASEWSISECEHLKKVARYHKELESAGGEV